MSTPSQKTCRTDVLPDHILSPFPLSSFGEIEHEFGRQWADQLVTADPFTEPDLWRIEKEFVAEKLKERQFAFGMKEFDRRCIANESVAFLLYISVRVKHPAITRRQAAALLTEQNYRDVREVLLDFMGFEVPKKETPAESGSPSTSTGFTPASAPTEGNPLATATEKSPA